MFMILRFLSTLATNGCSYVLCGFSKY